MREDVDVKEKKMASLQTELSRVQEDVSGKARAMKELQAELTTIQVWRNL